ncbi:MAG: hypothetical protein ABIF40_04975 [archaeon]
MVNIELVKNKYRDEPKEIWANTEMDEKRRSENLCRLCEHKNNNFESCAVAKKLFAICQEDNMAMAITRCGAVDGEGNLMFKKIE